MNEFRLGFMGEYDLLTPQTLGQGWPAKLGMQFAKADIFPTINITNFYNRIAAGCQRELQREPVRLCRIR